MSGQGQIAIQPVTLDTLPRAAEGSKALLIVQRWNDPSLAGGILATYNLLQQFQSGQFTTIQSVWIDNGTNLQPVVLTALETGQTIRVAALTQGMFPIVSGVAPVFTLALESTVFVSAATTRIMFFNTPQRYFVQPSPPVISSIGNNSGGFSAPATPALFFVGGVFGPNNYIALTGFQLSLSMTAGAVWAGNTPVTIIMALNGVQVWSDVFNCTAASFGMVYSKAVGFPAPTAPQLLADSWTLIISALPPGGTIQFFITYYYQLINIS